MSLLHFLTMRQNFFPLNFNFLFTFNFFFTMSNHYFLFHSELICGQPYPGRYLDSVYPSYELRSAPFRAESLRFYAVEVGDFCRIVDIEGLLIELPEQLMPSKGSTHVLQIGETWHYLWPDFSGPIGSLRCTEITENIPLSSVFE